MKIIQKGENPDLIEKEITCDYCNSVLRYDYRDIKYIKNRLGSKTYKSIKCPVCEKSISIK